MGPEIGVITEQGDLGLGYNVLNEQDKSAYDKSNKNTNVDKDDKKDN